MFIFFSLFRCFIQLSSQTNMSFLKKFFKNFIHDNFPDEDTVKVSTTSSYSSRDTKVKEYVFRKC